MREVTIPSVGMAMTEAVLNAWLKNPGDTVVAGEAIAEIETDKSSLDLESPSGGVLGRHLIASGASVPVGQVIVRILDPGETEPDDHGSPPAAAGAATIGTTSPSPGTAGTGTAGTGTASTGAAGPGTGSADGRDETVRTGSDEREPHRLSPRKRRELAEAQAQADAQAAAGRRGSRFRAAIAEHVSESWRTIPHFAVVRQIDARALQQSLATMRDHGLPATATDLLLRALALAVTAAAGAEGDLGLAVATPAGVIIPVVAGVPGLSPGALIAARAAAVARARDGQLAAADLTARPAASLSNLGGYAVESFTGIIPVGQQLLLTTGTIADRPVVIDGQVTIRPSFAATLNVDHRHFDGDHAARVLAAFQAALDESVSWAATREKLDA